MPAYARAGTDYVDLYYLHRVDPATPIESVMGTFKDLHSEGKIKYAGLSEVTAGELRRAHAVFPVTAIQMEWSLQTRDLEASVVPTARELGIGIVPYSPLGRGLLAGAFKKPSDLDPQDWRVNLPRFKGDNFDSNAKAVEALAALATKRGCTPGQLALAWVLVRGGRDEPRRVAAMVVVPSAPTSPALPHPQPHPHPPPAPSPAGPRQGRRAHPRHEVARPPGRERRGTGSRGRPVGGRPR